MFGELFYVVCCSPILVKQCAPNNPQYQELLGSNNDSLVVEFFRSYLQWIFFVQNYAVCEQQQVVEQNQDCIQTEVRVVEERLPSGYDHIHVDYDQNDGDQKRLAAQEDAGGHIVLCCHF